MVILDGVVARRLVPGARGRGRGEQGNRRGDDADDALPTGVTRGGSVLLKYSGVRGLHVCDGVFHRPVGAGGRDGVPGRGAGCLPFAPLEHVFALYEPKAGDGALPGRAARAAGVWPDEFYQPRVRVVLHENEAGCRDDRDPDGVFLRLHFRNIPYFESYKPYFLTTHMSAWLQMFVPHVPWRQISVDLAYLGALDVTFVVIGIVAFSQRDFKG